MLTLLIFDLMDEAYNKGRHWVALFTVFGFACAFLLGKLGSQSRTLLPGGLAAGRSKPRADNPAAKGAPALPSLAERSGERA